MLTVLVMQPVIVVDAREHHIHGIRIIMSLGQDLATSVATLMGLSGDFGEQFCPLNFFKWMKANGCWNGTNGFTPSIASNYTGREGVFKLLAIDDEAAMKAIEAEGSFSITTGDRIQLASKELMYDLAVELAKNGAYVVLRVAYQANGAEQHFIPVIDVVEADNELGYHLVVGDPATAQDDEEGAVFLRYAVDHDGSPADTPKDPEALTAVTHSKKYATTTYDCRYLVSIRVFTSATPFNGRDGNGINSATAEEMRAASTLNYSNITSILSEDYFFDIAELEEKALTLPNRSSLGDFSYDDISEMENWKQNLEYEEEDNMHGFLRGVLMFVGILVIVYSTLIFIAYQFDVINNFVEISILKIITFGRLLPAKDEAVSTYNSSEKVKLLSQRDVIAVTVVGILIGVLILTGKLFTLVAQLLGLIARFFEGF